MSEIQALREVVALAILNVHRERLGGRGILMLEQLPDDPIGGGNDSHQRERLLQQAEAAINVIKGKILHHDTITAVASHPLSADLLKARILKLFDHIEGVNHGE
jgi:hypothetical protein